MTKLFLRLSAILLPLSLLTAAPSAAQVIITKPGDTTEFMVLAVMAAGPAEDMDRFEAAAEAAGYKPGRPAGPGGVKQVMISVMPDANRSKFLKFYHEARAGKYGNLTFRVAITPWSAVQEERDFIDEARVYQADEIPLPKK
jgi:hypothetical protein